MSLIEREYNALIVSTSSAFSQTISPVLSTFHCQFDTAQSLSEAKRRMAEKEYDFLIINAPLSDGFGTQMAIDISTSRSTVVLMIVKSELHDEIFAKVKDYGVFTLGKPTSIAALQRVLMALVSAREKTRLFEKKSLSIEEKMKEIRLVNRAKWLLISELSMSETDAHRYIEKTAMDCCISKAEVAKDIIKTYS